MKVWLCTLERRYMHARPATCNDWIRHRNCGWFELLPVKVFVTSHGKHYHYTGPGGHLFTGSRKNRMNLADAQAAGYTPCKFCFPRRVA